MLRYFTGGLIAGTVVMALLFVLSWSGCGSTPMRTGDTTPPTVVYRSPEKGDVAGLRSKLIARFSEPMNPATMKSPHIGITNVTGSLTYNEQTLTATFTPNAPLSPDSEYEAFISSTVTDLAGNRLAIPEIWKFYSRPSGGNLKYMATFGTTGGAGISTSYYLHHSTGQPTPVVPETVGRSSNYVIQVGFISAFKR